MDIKRAVRRTLAIVLGLALGWYFAGLMPASLSTTQVSLASTVHQTHVDASHAGQQNAHSKTAPESHGSVEHGRGTHGNIEHDNQEEGNQEHGEGHGAMAVAYLGAGPAQSPWLGSVLAGVLGLFIAAIVLGIPALKLRGPEQPDPADAHDDHGDDDGHH